jgi:hypothetical protein
VAKLVLDKYVAKYAISASKFKSAALVYKNTGQIPPSRDRNWQFAVIRDKETQDLFDKHFAANKAKGKISPMDNTRIINDILYANSRWRKNQPPPAKALDRKTILGIKVWLGLNTLEKPNQKNKKKIAELNDPRNAAAEAWCATKLVQPYADHPEYTTPLTMIWNPDGVTIQVPASP